MMTMSPGSSWDQDLLDIGLKGLAVDRSVQDHGRGHAREPQAGNEGGGLAVAVRHAHAQPLTPWSPAMLTGHLGRCPGLIDEHQALGIEVELSLGRGLAPPYDVGALLLRGVGGLFLRVILWRSRNRQSAP